MRAQNRFKQSFKKWCAGYAIPYTTYNYSGDYRNSSDVIGRGLRHGDLLCF